MTCEKVVQQKVVQKRKKQGELRQSDEEDLRELQKILQQEKEKQKRQRKNENPHHTT